MMSRHDWVVLGLIGMSAFASGSLTYLVSQRMTDHSIPASTRVELGVEIGSDGGFFFTPLKPSVREPLRLERGMSLSAPPLRLKRSESALGHWGTRRKGSVFRRPSEPARVRWRGTRVYMSIPAADLVGLERIHFRR
jgi:hypothetical protein